MRPRWIALLAVFLAASSLSFPGAQAAPDATGVRFSAPGGWAARSIELTLRSAIPGTEIRFTKSARWGDYRRDAHSYKTGPYEFYTRNHHWRPEIQRISTEFFPKRLVVFTRQLREAQLLNPEK